LPALRFADQTTKTFRHLVLSGGLGELEDDITAGEAAVDLGVGVEAVVNTATLLLVCRILC